MVTIRKIDKQNIEIDGIKISIEEYNARYGWYKDDELAIKKEQQELAEGIFMGESKRKPNVSNDDPNPYYTTEEYLKEMEKIKKVNYNAYHEAEPIYNEIKEADKIAFHKIWEEDNEERVKGSVEHNNKTNEKLLGLYKKVLPKLKQLFTQKEKTGNGWGNEWNDPLKDKSREELDRTSKELNKYREEVKKEIEKAMNQDPQITNQDLEFGNQDWLNEIYNTHISLGKKEIDDIKNRVLAGIKTVREAKVKVGDKRKRDEEDNSDQKNKKPKLLTDELTKLIQNAKSQSTFDGLKTILAEIKKHEDQDYYKKFSTEIAELEKALKGLDSDKYSEEVKKELNQKLTENGVKESDLDNETQQLISQIKNGEITDDNKINQVKEKIGKKGAENSLTKLMEEARKLKEKLTKGLKGASAEAKKTLAEMKKFIESSNIYQQLVYQDNKDAVNALMKDLEGSTSSIQPTSPKFPWAIAIPVSLVAVLAVAAIVVVVRKRKQAKVEK